MENECERGRGARTLGYGSMLISQETHDKVECFFEKLFDSEQRVESRCRSKRSSKTRYIYHNLCQFVCAAVAIRDWDMAKGVGEWYRDESWDRANCATCLHMRLN